MTCGFRHNFGICIPYLQLHQLMSIDQHQNIVPVMTTKHIPATGPRVPIPKLGHNYSSFSHRKRGNTWKSQ
jgi:hypothetical protein